MNINYIFEELNIHFKRIDAILPEIEKWMPISSEDFEKTEIVKTIDSFIYRFIKIQDRMGDKLFPEFLNLLQEYKSNMALIDVLNDLERLGIFNKAEEWIDFRKLRNTLTHEYPGNEEEIIEALQLALDAYKRMKEIYLTIVNEVENRKLNSRS
jgi:hypothetical protein